MDPFQHPLAETPSSVPCKQDLVSSPPNGDTRNGESYLQNHEGNAKKRIRLRLAATLMFYSLIVDIPSWQYILPTSSQPGIEADSDLSTSYESPSNAANQALPSKIPKDFKLSTLKGRSNYETWIAEFEVVLRKMGIAYIMECPGQLDTRKKRLDNWLARNLIFQHVSAARVKRIRQAMGGINLARYAWQLLNSDILSCPCNDLQKDTKICGKTLSNFQEEARDGCMSCQLILDVIEAYIPRWAILSKIAQSISVETSSGLVQVSLEGPTWGQCEFFVRPDLSKWLSRNRQANSPTSNSQSYIYLQIAATWLKDCIESHSRCAIADQNFMPTRLIDVGCSDSEPFLVEGKLEPAPYVALSYCWGTVANVLMTTRDNVADHRRRIPFSSLPRTLRDAVTVCRNMNVRYLWIDALCIIQNDVDEQDWYTESGKMRHIYSNCLFAIAADISTNSDEGFLLERYNRPSWCTFTRTNAKAKQQVVFYRTPDPFEHCDSDTLLSSALSKRGWALQESILPNRILHFAADEIIWECNTHCQCQCGLSNYSLVKVSCCGILKARHPSNHFIYDDEEDKIRDLSNFLSSRTLESVYWAWQTVVEYYSQRQLTNYADKLSALSGLAQVAIDSHGFGGGAYLAGLWRDSLVKGLLWHVTGPSEPQRSTMYRAPSWSWASINGSVKYFAEQYQFQFQEHITIQEATCVTSPLDPTGRVKAGYIFLGGRLMPVTLFVQKAEPLVEKSKYTGYNGDASHTHKDQMAYIQSVNGEYMCEVLLDERMEYGRQDDGYYCLETGTTFDPLTHGRRIWWLILREQAGCAVAETRTFERVGIGYKNTRDDTLDLFSHATMQDIQLV